MPPPVQEPPALPSVLFTVLSLVALGAVVLTVQSVLSPFVVLAGVVFLLYPYRDNVLVRRSLVLAALLVGLWAFTALFGILVPFLFAYLLCVHLRSHRDATRPPWHSALGEQCGDRACVRRMRHRDRDVRPPARHRPVRRDPLRIPEAAGWCI